MRYRIRQVFISLAQYGYPFQEVGHDLILCDVTATDDTYCQNIHSRLEGCNLGRQGKPGGKGDHGLFVWCVRR
jgi:hypothetical protein